MRRNYIPECGDIVQIDFSPQKGHEQAHRRPALVVSSRIYNEKTGMMLACPITSKIKGYSFEVGIEIKKQSGVILADHIRSMDWHSRGLVFIQKAPIEVLDQVQQRIIRLLSD